MKKRLYQLTYKILLFLSNRFYNQTLIRFKLAVGSSLLLLNGGYIEAQVRQEDASATASIKKTDLQSLSQTSQQSDTISHYCYTAAILPEFPGGQKELNRYLNEEIRKYDYSDSWKDGRCYISFLIDKTGKVTNPQIVHSLSSEQDTVSLRIVKEMPFWKPGKIKDKLVNMKQTIPVVFSGYEIKPEWPAGQTCYVIDDRFAEFHGGRLNLKAYIAEHTTYPPYQLDTEKEGAVIVSFWIDLKGQTREAQIIKSLTPALDKVALKLIEEMPQWEPARRRGKPVKSKHTLTIPFKRKF